MDPHTTPRRQHPPVTAVPLPATPESDRPDEPAGPGDVPQQRRDDDASAQVHATETGERGAFCTARCTCGWRGPARRSRDLARKDAAAHETHPN
ncbi:hypothetical protein [Streptomyces sp. NRRL S-87]|uniref:hypothetical protein n=1 Tax=Streptomyces sp. NRRL S-87 TaxID=1463920 RepID=UPI00055B2184|nr:hypothetical protein [Streptomyces sp. NRRL S-87]